MTRSIRVVGHRGCRSICPENTIPAFEKAIEFDVDAIEFDVRFTKDRQLVVCHDETIDRCSDHTGKVCDYTLAELRSFDFGVKHSEAFRGTRIPTYSEVLDCIVQKSKPTLQILIELKENNCEETDLVMAELVKRNILDRVLVLSFAFDQLKHVRSKFPAIPIQCFTCHFADANLHPEQVATKICLFSSELTKENVTKYHDLNMDIDTVPVDTVEQLDWVHNFDVDTITTNAPEVIMPLVHERKLQPPAIPTKRLAWRLYGAGMENFGDDGKPVEIPVPELKPNEILTKVEALGLCFSDVKIIRAGESHPKIYKEDMKKDPLIIGHEAVLTILKTGADIPKKYAPGQRFLIQCDVFVKGKSCAYGYGMDGGLTQYSVIDHRVWKGETESYLLDCPDNLSSLGAALLEPWTCVRASYHIPHRPLPKTEGSLLLVTEQGNEKIYSVGPLFKGMSRITTVNFSAAAVKAIEEETGTKVNALNELPPEGELYDDIVCVDLQDKDLGEKTLLHSENKAIITFYGDCGKEAWKIDVGALHYKNRYYQGAKDGTLDGAYNQFRRQDLTKDGCTWFPGGAGAMGQMHVELALLSKNAPKKIMVTDMDDKRIAHLQSKLGARAAALGIELEIFNPGKISEGEFNAKLRNFAPKGFDDIVILVPSSKVIDQALPHLADNGLMNVFAGIPAGETSAISIERIICSNIRFTGSSGSSTPDMIDALRAAGEHEFEPQSALAAIAGFYAVKEGYNALIAGTFPGKVVILPDCLTMPLIPFDKEHLPQEILATLDKNGYTLETEKTFKKLYQ